MQHVSRLELVYEVVSLRPIKQVELLESARDVPIRPAVEIGRHCVDPQDARAGLVLIQIFQEVTAHEAGEAGDEVAIHNCIKCLNI